MRPDREADFIQSLGPAFLAHLLRRVSDQLVEADQQWHAEAGVLNPPRTSSTLLALDAKGPMSVTQLAGLLRQSHQLVMQWIDALRAAGLVETIRDPKDARRLIVSLTDAGRDQMPALRRTIAAVEQATQAMLAEIAPGLFENLWGLERALRNAPFVDQIRAANQSLPDPSIPQEKD
ncbi:MarR family winged helix-turn-helix transcriptional regulator [Niveispirillum sp. KHB5.9]|uniref:MarR family winged helix-turn-helix transcriptional regulator n=1 Tax=Niveispirillum sp. KHB5.9 TaxID=3400269 RepID=UPI003A83C213